MPEDEKSVKGFIPQHYFLPLEESLYSLGDAESVFFKSQTGIQDDEQLKKHIVMIQEQAFSVRNSLLSASCCQLSYTVSPYIRFIRTRAFVTTRSQSMAMTRRHCMILTNMVHRRLKISRISAYDTLLNLGKQKEGAIFLDIGCCCESYIPQIPIPFNETFEP